MIAASIIFGAAHMNAMTFALVLILGLEAPAVTTVQGFTTLDACKAAGEMARQRNQSLAPLSSFCIEVK